VAFVAGYVTARPQYSTAELSERLRSFPILPDESTTAYENRTVAIGHGHLVIKHETARPLPPGLVVDEQGNALATLGFMVDQRTDLLTSCMATAGRALEECHGEFVTAFADAANGALHIVNDRFAARPCYVLRTVDAVYFSSNIAWLFVLARERYRPDAVGWLEVFSYAHTNGGRTTAHGVQRLRPGTHLRITPGDVRERQYWRLEHQPDPGLDPERHSSEVFQAFVAGAGPRARLVDRGVIALSGGLDSRLVAAAVPKDNHYGAFTFIDVPGRTSTAQTRAAAQVAAALGLPHRIEALPRRFTQPRDVIALTGGMRPYHHMAIVMAYVNEAQQQGAKFLLGGGPGDVLAGSYVPSPAYLDPTRTVECIEDACRRRLTRRRYWPLVFRDDVIAASQRLVETALAESFAAVAGPTAAHRITAWGMVYRQPAFTFTSVLHTHPDVTEAACHLDYRYSDLMLRLPAAWLYDEAFYAYMIYRELPQLRHVPYANTGARITGQRPSLAMPQERLVERAQSFGVRAARKVVRMILPRRRRPNRWLVVGDPALMAEVQEILHAEPSLGDVLDVRRCDDFIEKVRSGVYRNHAHEEVLGGLASMCFCAVTLR
jgi:glutamine amidotransferase-like protein/asparagine synthase